MRFILTFLCFLSGFYTLAQQASVTGVITDKETKEPIPFVSVVTADGTGAATDMTGRYTLELSPGTHKLTFSFVGYEKQSKQLTLKEGETQTMDVILQSVSLDIDIVVVSAGKFEQDLGEVTVSMEVLKPNVIENRNTTQLDEVLQQTPGVSIVDNEPQIRSGSGYSFGAGSRVMVLMDDLPILSGDAGRPSWGFLPIENVEQVEVIKGASSVLYGSAALSGVINLRTAYPKEKPQTKITAFVGAYSDPQTREAKYWEGQPIKTGFQFLHSRRIGQFDLVFGGNFLADDGHLGPIISSDSLGNPADTASSRFNPFDVNRYGAETRARFNFNTRYRSKKYKGLSFGVNSNWLVGDGLATLVWENADSGLYQAFSGAATRTEQFIASVDPFVEYYTENGSSHSLRGRWQNLDNDNDNDQGNFSDVYFAQYLYQQNYERYGIKDFKSTFGVMTQQTTGVSELYAGDNDEGDNYAANYAAFLQLDKTFKERLTVSAGVRYEYFEINGENDSRPVFRTGVNYQAAEATYFRGSYGQGYRFPSIAEKFIQTAIGPLVIFPNGELQPENSFNTEIGFKQGFKIGEFKGFLDLAAFYQEFDNFIEFTFGQWDPNPTFDNLLGLGFRSVNTGRASVSGAEISVLGTGELREGIELSLLAGYTYTLPRSLTPDLVYASSAAAPVNNYSYTSTSFNSNNDILKYRMQHLIRADAEIKTEKFMFGLSYRFNSPIENIDQAFLDVEQLPDNLVDVNWGLADWMDNRNTPVHIIDLRAGYYITPQHRVSLVIWNLNNREYAIRPLAVEAPRLTTIQYSVNF